MALEKNLNAVPPVLLTADGTAHGVCTIVSTCNFFVKQQVTLQGPLLPPLTLEVKRVVNYTTLWLGIKGPQMTHNVDLSAYTVAAGAFIFAEEQSKAALPQETRDFASYVQEPVNAWRSQAVDCNGNPYGAGNPYPVTFDGTISISQVEVIGANGNIVEPNVDGSINVNIVSTPVAGNTVKNVYNEANSVVSGATTLLVQYTVPLSATSSVLERISVSGENIAKYTVFWNTTQIDTRRTFYGSSLSEYFEFTTGSSEGFTLAPGDTIKVYLLHNRPYVGDFEGRIQVLEIT
jgi:hypothetical protein